MFYQSSQTICISSYDNKQACKVLRNFLLKCKKNSLIIFMQYSKIKKRTITTSTRGSQEHVIACLVYNLTLIFSRKISADSFFILPFEISANSNGSHLGSMIISAQVSEQ